MEQYGYIPKIVGGVAFSDPSYKADVWCQYRKNFTDTNWLIRMESKTETFDSGFSYVDFILYCGRPTMMEGTVLKEEADGKTISFATHYAFSQQEVGMDTACIFIGSMKNFKQFGKSAALHTGTDGPFGDLFVFTCKGEEAPAGFVLKGSIDETFADEKSLFQHILSGFDGREISHQEYLEQTDRSTLSFKTLHANEVRTARKYEQAHPAPSQDAPER